MTDELKQKLTERFEQLKESSDIAPLPIYLNDALLKAYLAGGMGMSWAILKEELILDCHIQKKIDGL